MAKHKRVLAYGKTYEGENKPLILIIGREPSFDADSISDALGSYDFDAVRSASFWNVAHRYIGNAAGLGKNELEQKCRDDNRSPLVIGDALPIGVENGNPSVSESRASVSESDIEHHVESTLSLSSARVRVKLIVLAGHTSGATGSKEATKKLAFANSCFRKKALELNSEITVVDIPFLTDQNAPALRRALAEDNIPQIISTVLEEFF